MKVKILYRIAPRVLLWLFAAGDNFAFVAIIQSGRRTACLA